VAALVFPLWPPCHTAANRPGGQKKQPSPHVRLAEIEICPYKQESVAKIFNRRLVTQMGIIYGAQLNLVSAGNRRQGAKGRQPAVPELDQRQEGMRE